MRENQNIERNKTMKKLTQADIDLLKARGKVASLTTVTDFEIPSWDRPKKAKKATTKKANNHPLVGKVLHTSWGYNMTWNDFCQIIEVSPTGKTVVCRMLNTDIAEFNGFTGTVKAGNKLHGEKFRLRVRESASWGTSFVGTYSRYEGRGGRKGYFSLYDGSPCYENHMD